MNIAQKTMDIVYNRFFIGDNAQKQGYGHGCHMCKINNIPGTIAQAAQIKDPVIMHNAQSISIQVEYIEFKFHCPVQDRMLTYCLKSS